MPDKSDGYCGAPGPVVDGIRIWCRFEVGHAGKHSWAGAARNAFAIGGGGITHAEVVARASQGHPAALAMFDTQRADHAYFLFVGALCAALDRAAQPYAVV